MTNISLLLIELIICLITIIIIYKLFKVEGLYAYTIIASIISNIMSLKIISIYNFDINLGIIPFIMLFISSNILIQKKGPEEIKKVIIALIFSSVISYAIFYLTSLMNSSSINLFTNASYDNIFEKSTRIYFANLVTIIYTLLLNSKLYYYLKTTQNKIWISNIFSAIIVQFIASILFAAISYAFTKEPLDIIKIIILRYTISLLTCIIGTIPIYITNKIKEK